MTMATSTELLRAAEHMRERARETHLVDLFATARHLEDEARRLQDIEAQQPRRSWPEGWPPFEVLRRAYAVTGASPRPSVRRMSRLAPGAASSFRRSWEKALEMVSSATSTP